MGGVEVVAVDSKGAMKEFIEKHQDQIHGVLFLFRSHVIPRLSADHERVADAQSSTGQGFDFVN